MVFNSKPAELVHMLGGRGSNVMCYNGSAHRRATTNESCVTCPKCKEAMNRERRSRDPVSRPEKRPT